MFGSDIVSENGLRKGKAVSLALMCANEKELKNYFKRLSAGGTQIFSLEKTHWGTLFGGGLTDEFGNNWLLYCDANG